MNTATMNTAVLLQELSCQGVKFWLDDGQLRSGGDRNILTPQIISTLKQQKAEIVRLLEEESDIFNIHPLSHGQKAFWFLWQLAPESHAYNQIFSARICSELDVVKMQSAFRKLLERHPCLRSTYPKRGDEPIQQIHQAFELDWHQIVASGWSEAELRASVIRASQHPFNLERDLAARIRLFTVSPQEHVLLISLHHIATDGWSLDIILSELAKLYQAEIEGTSALLPELKHTYSEYVDAEKNLLSGSKGEKLFDYWQAQLQGELPGLNLPLDKPRPAIPTDNGASIKFQLSEELTHSLKQLAISSEATPYMLLLAAFKVLLYRYTGNDDLLVGSPVAGRLQSKFREIVGYCANQVVIRGDLSENPTFNDFLHQIRQTVTGALTHQDYPIALLIEKLRSRQNSHKNAGHSQLFQVFFALQQLQKSQLQNLFTDEKDNEVDWGGLTLKPFLISQQEGHFDLTLEMMEAESAFKGFFKYNTDLFEAATIERMAAHFQNLLLEIVETPHEPVGTLNFLSAAERTQLLQEWNNTATDYPLDKCVHQLFEEQVAKTPNALAIVSSEETLTYQQLNQRANQLAYHLQTLGVTQETLVGICVERSVDLVVGFLGILKAGGVYVPLDPSYPQERLNYLINDTSVDILLSQQALSQRLPSNIQKVIYLDNLPALLSTPLSNPDCLATPHNLAYIIYTSGSTGQPKGAMIEHLGCVNHCYAMIDNLSLNESDNIAQTAPIGFDISVWQILTALLVGGRVTIINHEIIQDPAWLFQDIHKQEISILQVVPSVLRALLDVCEQSECLNLPDLKWLLVTGETFPAYLLDGWFEYYPDIPLMNAYGPAECSDDVTLYPIYHSNH
ncbi:MAG: condensation domain-containing protein [Cyanobacteria bacterium P01_F01_bin.86]